MSITAVKAFSNASVSKKVSMSGNQNSASNTSFSSNLVTSENNKLPYVAAGIAVLAIGGYLLHRNYPQVKKFVKELADKFINPENKNILNKIKKVKNDSFPEINRIIQENSSGDIIRLEGMDAAALMRAKDKTRPNYLYEAADMIEESYKMAYDRSKPQQGLNIFDKIMNRLKNESDALVQVYSEMPDKDSTLRLSLFSKDLASLSSAKKEQGMSKSKFVNDVLEMIRTKRK